MFSSAAGFPRRVSLLALLAALLLPHLSLAVPAQPSAEADVRGKLKGPPRQAAPEIDPASEEAQQALTRMKLPAGIVAKLWAAEPMFANPVAFNFDERGRVFVAETFRYRTSVLDIRDYMWTLEDDLANRNQDDFLASIRKNFGEEGVQELSKESERLTLLEDTNGDGVADKATVYADNFRSPIDGIAAGVLAHRGDVYFSNIPSLWKFTGADKAETRTELLRGFGLRFNFTGHDFHGLTLGPDGRIYMSIGDRAAHVTTKENTIVDAPDTGSVFRCWPDGSGFELFATGLRNPQGLLFNEFGDLFTGDNDSDQGDMERLVHIVEGGDSGWRIGYQHHPRGNAGPWNSERLWLPRFPSQPAYLLPPICNIEDGPSGIAYYPGTGLTPAYAGHIFITHFKGAITHSGIFTYTVKPNGSSYAIDTAAPFLTGALPTDVRFGPDGKLYYSDWAEGWPKSRRGRIYAMFDPSRANDPLVKSTQALIASDDTKKSDTELADLLGHPDWRVRLEAQTTLAERGAAGLAVFTRVLQQQPAASALARRHAVWGLGEIGAKESAAALAALRPLLTDADAEVRAQAVKLIGDLRDAASREAVRAALNDPAARVKFFAAQSLGKLHDAAAVPALLEAARANHDADAYLRHAIVLGLAGCATPETLAATTKDESRSVRLAAVLALRRQGRAEIAHFLGDADPLIVREAVEAVNDVPIVAAYPAIAAFVEKPVASEPIMLRALNAHFRLGTATDALALAAYAANPQAAEAMRKEAIALLALWPAPPARDRIVGIYRPLAEKTRPANVAASALAPQVAKLLVEGTPDTVQSAAIDAVVTLKISAAGPSLQAVVAAKTQSGPIRAAALKALDKLGDPQLESAVALALAADAAELRLAALPISSRLNPAASTGVLAKLIASGTPAEQRAAFKALGESPQAGADDLLLAQLQRLAAHQVPAPAQLDLLNAAAQRGDPRVKAALASRDAALAQDADPLAAFRVSLEGGNAGNGARLFYTQPVIQCVRCHRNGDNPGGEAGPNLAGIGARETREYILESILRPSAKFAAGFEIVTVTRKNGEALVGTLLHRDAQGVKIKSGDNEVDIPMADIKGVESAPSAMPEVAKLVLTKDEVRDLVEYVFSLKTPATPRDKIPIRALVPPPTD